MASTTKPASNATKSVLIRRWKNHWGSLAAMPSVFLATDERYDDTLTPERIGVIRPSASSKISAKRWMSAEWKHGCVTENTNTPSASACAAV